MSTPRENWNAFGNADHANGKLLAVHLTLMDDFLQFCKNKKEKSCQLPINLNAGPSSEIIFKDKVVKYFGEYLPSDVIDELCKLVAENSYGKCHFCTLPTESLVLSVLQILLDASNKIPEKQDANFPTKSPSFRGCNVQNEQRGCGRGINQIISAEDGLHSSGFMFHPWTEHSHGGAGIRFQHIGEDTIVDCQGEIQEAMCQENQYIHNLGIKVVPITKTSLAMDAIKETVAPCKKRSREDVQMKFIHPSGRKEAEKGGIDVGSKSSPEVEIIGISELKKKCSYFGNLSEKSSPDLKVIGTLGFKKRCSDLGKITDKIYNNKFLSKPLMSQATSKPVPNNSEAQEIKIAPVILNASLPKGGSVCQFPISDRDLRYYKIICGLAHSDIRTTIGVQFFKTSVTFQSLGESVQPQGHADNFFIAVFCRKYFEDRHPRQLKKHYFYPRIGACLLSYSSLADVHIVKNSFVGANSAQKLHLSQKLFFLSIMATIGLFL